jgi:hypothetical protein
VRAHLDHKEDKPSPSAMQPHESRAREAQVPRDDRDQRSALPFMALVRSGQKVLEGCSKGTPMVLLEKLESDKAAMTSNVIIFRFDCNLSVITLHAHPQVT